MITTKIKTNNVVLFFILLLSIFPSINIGYEMPVLYLLLPLISLTFIVVMLGMIKVPKILKYSIYIMFFIILEIFISSMIITINRLDRFHIPTDIVQYIARFLFLIYFGIIFLKGKISPETFIKWFLIFLNISVIIGILQWIPWRGRELFIRLYPFRDGSLQLSQLDRPLYILRLHGFAQHATSNGGLVTFFFVFGYSVFKYYKKHRLLSLSLMGLCIISIFASQAKAGMLAFVFAFFLFYIIDIYIDKRNIKKTIYIFIMLLLIIFVSRQLFISGNPFINQMVIRFQALFDAKGGGRVDQMKYFLSLFENTSDYIFGLSKAVINSSEISYGVEVEPVNIFILYGLLGFTLQYSLIGLLLAYFFRSIKNALNNKAVLALLISSFVGLFSYQVFSVGYYFFREIRVGLFPWILMGATIGAYERYKLKKRSIK